MIINKKIGSILLASFLSLNLMGITAINPNAISNELNVLNINSFGGNDVEEFNSVVKTSDGGYVTVGQTNSTDIEGITNKGSYDAFIIKYDSNGNQEWIKGFGGNDWDNFNSVVQTSDGGFIAVGDSQSSKINNISNKGLEDAVIVKFDNKGIQQWVKYIGGSDRDSLMSVIEMSDGSFITVGYSDSIDMEGFTSNGNDDGIIAKFNQDGTQQWIKNFGGSGWDELLSVAKTKDNGFVVVGDSDSTDIDGFTNKGTNDGIIVKFNQDGDKQWINSIGGSDGDKLASVIETSDGNFVAVGYSDSTDIDGITNKGNNDGIIAKFNKDGNKQWVNSFSGNDWDEFESVIESSDGKFLAVGNSNSTDIEGMELKGYYDAIMVKYDSQGNQELINSVGGSKYDEFKSITEISKGNFIAVGYLKSIDIEGVTLKGNQDALIVKEDRKLVPPEGIQTSKDLNIQVVADNTLEMSLSTNQISFSGYNGTEDLINNDLNITVSSGLNYDLFAKLNDELRGTNDIEAIIDKSNLKIKTLTDSEYKEFANINENITLVSNATNGNNNIHNINFKLLGDSSVKADTYNTSITFEAVQK